MGRASADRLKNALDALESTFGRVPVLPPGNPMDQLVALFLFGAGGGAWAKKAVDLLREEFVDWNEVRISWPREVARPLAAAGCPTPRETAGRLLGLLERIYKDRNAVNLAFLGALEAEEAHRWLRSLRVLDDGTAAAVASLFLADGGVLPSPDLLKIAAKLGIAGDGTTPARARKVLEGAVEKDGRVRIHYLLARHAEDLKRPKTPAGDGTKPEPGARGRRDAAAGKNGAAKSSAPAPQAAKAVKATRAEPAPSPDKSARSKNGKAAGGGAPSATPRKPAGKAAGGKAAEAKPKPEPKPKGAAKPKAADRAKKGAARPEAAAGKPAARGAGARAAKGNGRPVASKPAGKTGGKKAPSAGKKKSAKSGGSKAAPGGPAGKKASGKKTSGKKAPARPAGRKADRKRPGGPVPGRAVAAKKRRRA